MIIMVILTRHEILELLRSSPPLIEGLIDLDKQLQPAGVDLTVKEIFTFKSSGKVDFTNKDRELSELELVPFDEGGWAFLKPGFYLIKYNEVINMPLDLIAIGKPRSTLLRMGAFIVTAVWDPGYKGRSVSLLIVGNPNGIRVKRNARVVQLVFLRLTKKSVAYKGIYLGEG